MVQNNRNERLLASIDFYLRVNKNMTNIYPNDSASSFKDLISKQVNKWRIKLNKLVTTPMPYYVVMIIISLVMIVLSISILQNSTIGSFIGNIGYGVFCSTLVALLIDCGATKRQRAIVVPNYLDDPSKLNVSDELPYYMWITEVVENNTGSDETINLILDLFFGALDEILECGSGYCSFVLGGCRS